MPHIGAGLRFMAAPTDYLAELRSRHGDTFEVSIFGFSLLVTFSPRGLESLYRVEEQDASFGLATFDMMAFKTPQEIFRDADPALFRLLLQPQRLPCQLELMDAAASAELARWGEAGTLDVFDAIRTLEQRAGFALWIAPEAAADRWWPALKRDFDVLDQESAFVDPAQALETMRSGKAAERAALQRLRSTLAAIAAERTGEAARGESTLDLLRERFADADPAVRDRRVAHNIVNANQGFLSNLYAAIGWVIVHLLEYPDALARLQAEIAAVRTRYGEDFTRSATALGEMVWCEQLLMESVRLGQRSITLRKVLRELDFDTGEQVYRLQPGVYIATMLSVTNTQTEELARFDPGHYRGNQLRGELAVHGRESISTFGHGHHACPAQRFSHSMCKIVVARLLERFELEPLFAAARPATRQMGGVARPQEPARMSYRRRA